MSTPADYLSPAMSGYGIYQGATSGNPVGQARAGLNTANLYGKLSGAGGVNTGATSALDALNIYQGLQQGGWQGYGKAGASGLQLAGLLANNPELSAAGGYLAAPLALYNFGENWRSGATGADALSGAQTGAEVGSIIPGVGTVVGGVVGGALGALSSAFGPGAKDPETAGVQNVINATGQAGNNTGVAASMQDPYLGLAGLMDERSSTLPEYAQYGRMGEQKFTDDMVTQINDAVKADPSLAQNPSAVYNQVVAPWVNKMGSGYSNVGSTYTATNQGLLEDMTQQYLSGNAAQDWKAIGGDEPFQDIYQGSPISEAASPPEPNARLTAGTPRGASRFSEGGNVNNDLRSRLKELYEGSFAKRVRHFDGGGYVNYGNNNYYTMPINSGAGSPFSFNQSSPSTPYDVLPVNSGAGSPSTNNWGLSDPSAGATDAAYQAYINAGGSPNSWNAGGSGGSGGSSSSGSNSSSSVLGQGGALSGLGNLLGVSSMGQLVQKYGALAPLLAAAVGGSKTASPPATPAGYGAIPSIATPNNNRSYTQPNVANWYTYGQGPEQSFFSNNQLPNIPGVSPSAPASSTPPTPASTPAATSPGQATTQPVPYMGGPRPIMRGQGGPAFDSTQGDSYVPDPGHGDGTSDSVDAKLSGGEYVMDGGTVSMLGNGSNEAGARALDQLRARVRKHAGKQLVKGKQFMKAKSPETYLQGGNPAS